MILGVVSRCKRRWAVIAPQLSGATALDVRVVGRDRKQLRWQSLPTECYRRSMTTMNVSLPEELRTFVDERVEDGRYGSTSEYVRELIRRDQDRHRLRGLLLDGATSARGPVADDAYFAALGSRVESGT